MTTTKRPISLIGVLSLLLLGLGLASCTASGPVLSAPTLSPTAPPPLPRATDTVQSVSRAGGDQLVAMKTAVADLATPADLESAMRTLAQQVGTWTPTPRPTATPSASPTHTPTPSQTPTPMPPAYTGTPTPTRPLLTDTPLPPPPTMPPTPTTLPATATRRPPTATPRTYPAPVLIAPTAEAAFPANATVTLSWQGVGALEPNVHYLLVVTHTQGKSWIITDRTTWDTPSWLPGYSPVNWWVAVCRGGILGESSAQSCTLAGPQSEERRFSWSSGSEPGNGPSPVATDPSPKN